MSKLSLSTNKILKLSNVIIIKIDKENFENIELTVDKIEQYIKIKGAKPVGPLIQYISTDITEDGMAESNLLMMRQCDRYINHVEQPYTIESIIRIKNCMYVRYVGPESGLKYAYDKIMLTSFEEDINLKGDSYTIFVDQQHDDNIIADVFMERAND